MITAPTITRIAQVEGSESIQVDFEEKGGLNYPNMQALREDVQEWLADFRNLRMFALAVALSKLKGQDPRGARRFALRIDPEKV